MYFAEQFDACMRSVKLKKVLSGESNYLEYMQAFRNNYLEGLRRQSIEKGAGSIRREEEDFLIRVSTGFRQKISSFSEAT